MADKRTMEVTLAEHKLLRRLRGLKAGTYLMTLEVGEDGPQMLILWSETCKMERLKGEG